MTQPKNESRLTPVNTDYPTCSETNAELRIYPTNLSISGITQRLEIRPTNAVEEGSTIISSTGRKRRAKRAGWFLTTRDVVTSNDLRDHLDWLIAKLLPARDKLISMQLESDVKMVVNCIWWSASGHGGPTLWPEQMAALAKLNLELSLDIYFAGELLGHA